MTATARPAEAVAGPPLRSLTGRPWAFAAVDAAEARAHAQGQGLPELIGRLLAARGVRPGEAAAFLKPQLKTDLPDPSRIAGMDTGAARLAAAVMAGEGLGVFGDYDVDGATSAALLIRYFRALGRTVAVEIPDRQRDGYGPNGPALRRLRAAGATVAVTVDCGTLAHAALAEGMAAGLDIIVCDHHLPGPTLPPVTAVVNPNRADDRSGCGELAAVGVAFLLAVAVNRALRQAGWFKDGREEPDLRALLDLVALGTIADVVPLRGVNRALVAHGLARLQETRNSGLAALRAVAWPDKPVDAQAVGFALAPRINAGGRVGRADLGVRLLTTEDAGEAAALAGELDRLNRARREIEADVLAAAIDQAGLGGLRGGLVAVADARFHPGVVGIVAGRLKERFGRPALVFSRAGGLARGSGRSVPGVDLGAAVHAALAEGLIASGGGHAMAAGLTLAEEGLEPLLAFLDARLAPACAAAPDPRTVRIEAALSPAGATPALADTIARVGPFGAGNPEPLLLVPDVTVPFAEGLGGGHVRGVAAGADGARLSFIAFRAAETALGAALLRRSGPLHLAGRLQRNDWNGTARVQLVLEDAAV